MREKCYSVLKFVLSYFKIFHFIPVIIIPFFIPFSLKGQDVYQDSLKQILRGKFGQGEKLEAQFKLAEYLVQRDPEEAEKLAKALDSLPFQDSMTWARINNIFAASLRWQGNYASAIAYYQSNYHFYKRRNYKDQIKESAWKLGTLHNYVGNIEAAQSYFLETKAILDESGSPKEKAGISNSLAGLYLGLEQKDKAVEYFLQSLQNFKAIQDSSGIGTVSINLGYIYSAMEQLDSAEMHLSNFLKYKDVFPTERELGFYHDFLGLIRKKQGRMTEALKEHSTALAIRNSLSSTYNLCETLLHYADILIELGRHREAATHLQRILSFEQHQSLNQQVRAHELLSLVYEKQSMHKQALDHYKSYKTIADSLLNKETIEVLAEKDAKYQREQKDNQITLLNQENALNSAKLRATRVKLTGAIAFILLFSVALISIIILYKNLQYQKNQVDQALQDKEALLKEIHHRVKNNLQVISSLLSLQSRKLEGTMAKEALQEGRNRVKSMALIHQNLYQDKDLVGVHLSEYVNKLSQSLLRSYHVDDEDVDIQTEIEDIRLDVDMIIPIGLILNELISNALKYAFASSENLKNVIKITIFLVNKELKIHVKDNGMGFAKDVDIEKSESLGYKLIHSFAKKLNARLMINSNGGGTSVSMLIPSPKIV